MALQWRFNCILLRVCLVVWPGSEAGGGGQFRTAGTVVLPVSLMPNHFDTSLCSRVVNSFTFLT